jgi:hypothetical protein
LLSAIANDDDEGVHLRAVAELAKATVTTWDES